MVDLQIGDCVAITKEGSRNFVKTPCDDPKANLFVLNMAAPNGSCPEDTRDTYAGVKTPRGEVQMCFNPNWIIGQCYKDDNHLIVAAACGADAPIKPVKKVTGDVHNADCPDGQTPWTWREPGTVMCVTEF